MGLIKTEQEFILSARVMGVPDHNIDSLVNYVYHGIRPGSFLEAVFCNDLKESFARADEQNRYCLFHIVRFMYSEMPVHSQGSPERVEKWIEHFREQRKQVANG